MKECFKKKCKICFNCLKWYVFNEDYKELVVGKTNKTHIYNISSILASVSIISGAIFMLIDVFYKMKCCDYFGIPPKYFSYDFKSMFIETLLKNLIWIILYLFIFYYYYNLKKRNKVFLKKNLKKIEKKAKIERNDSTQCLRLLIFKIFNAFIFLLWFIVLEYIVFYLIFRDFPDASNCTIIIMLIIGFIFICYLELKKIFLSKIFIIINILCLLFSFYYIRLENIYPENDKKYEVTIMKIDEKDEQVVVLSNSNDKCLVVNYEEKDGEAIFYTKKYYFINRENKEFSIKNFKNKSIDKKTDKNNVTKNLNNKSKM